MAALTYACESAVYRAGSEIERNQGRLKTEGMSEQEAYLKGIEEYAIECAICKVIGSESVMVVSDEGV